jgi:hypothetical protein
MEEQKPHGAQRGFPESVLSLYAGLMEEIKLRLERINNAQSELAATPGLFVLENCYLQIRMCCELIALACLVAHGDDPTKLAKKLQKHWSAEKIVIDLVNLNPSFFPEAVSVKRTGEKEHHMDYTEPSPLSRSSFLKIYGQCGDGLHRGSLDKLLSSLPPQPISLDVPIEWANKIRTLLQTHRINSADGSRQIMCELHEPVIGRVEVVSTVTLRYPRPRK